MGEKVTQSLSSRSEGTKEPLLLESTALLLLNRENGLFGLSSFTMLASSTRVEFFILESAGPIRKLAIFLYFCSSNVKV